MSNTELHEILEKQRGTFCQVAMLYFTAVMIGLGLLSWQQMTIGFWFLVIVDILFLTAMTGIFALLTYYLQKPGAQIDQQVTDLLKDVREHIEEGN